MEGKGASLLALGGVIAGVILATACGAGSGDQIGTASTASPVAATPTTAVTVTREMLDSMIPGTADLPGFTLSDARFVDNEGASAQAPDPAARLASLEEMGRVVGFHATFNRFAKAPPGAPSAILWSVNLFREPSGALDFINQRPEVSEDATYESLDVGVLGPNAVGFAFRGTLQGSATATYSIAFAEGVIQVDLTTLYEENEASPDYTLNLAQQARTLVASGLGSPPVSASSWGDGVTAASPTGTPIGFTVPTHAQVGAP